MSNVLKKILVPVLLLLICPACITEVDVGRCNNTVIRFEYFADGTEDVFPDYISSVTYCIYDVDGVIVTQATLDKSRLDQFQGLKIRLPKAGDYTVVAWGNFGDGCTLESSESLGGCRVMVQPGEPETFNRLYLGTLAFNLDSEDGRHEYLMRFHSAHVTLRAELQTTLEDGSEAYSIKVGEFASGVAGDGSVLGPGCIYNPKFVVGENGMIESITWLPRFDEETESVLKVYNNETGVEAASVNLKDYIREHAIKVTGVEEAVVDVLITVTGTDIKITFPGWKPEPVYPGI